MPVLIDTNVILDIVLEDPEWADWSTRQLDAHSGDGLWINPMVYTELSVKAESSDEVDELLMEMELVYLEFTRAVLWRTANAFWAYRQSGGSKRSPLPDFFIGAHAEVLDVPLLTRDVSRIRTYFPNVELICPENDP